MKSCISDLALFGGRPCFKNNVPVGQDNYPSWNSFRDMLKGILDRQYYTNHGPLAQELEARLCEFLGVSSAISVTNATIGLMLSLKSLELKGRVIAPAFSFPSAIQAILWAGLEPLLCDVDPKTYMLDFDYVMRLIRRHTVGAVIGVHLWGDICHTETADILMKDHGIKLLYDASHAFGCRCHGESVANLGDLSVFSFNPENIINSTEGGCICTNDQDLAERLRNIRSSYGRRKEVSIPIGGYGRFSEAQAGLAILNLDNFSTYRSSNKERLECYNFHLRNVPGIKPIETPRHITSTFQHVLYEISEAEVGLNRDELRILLTCENILTQKDHHLDWNNAPRIVNSHPTGSFPAKHRMYASLIQLPSGQQVTLDDIQINCEFISFCQKNSQQIRMRMEKQI